VNRNPFCSPENLRRRRQKEEEEVDAKEDNGNQGVRYHAVESPVKLSWQVNRPHMGEKKEMWDRSRGGSLFGITRHYYYFTRGQSSSPSSSCSPSPGTRIRVYLTKIKKGGKGTAALLLL
jgi:hypothetical protein